MSEPTSGWLTDRRRIMLILLVVLMAPWALRPDFGSVEIGIWFLLWIAWFYGMFVWARPSRAAASS